MGSALKQGKSEALKARLNRGDWSKNSPVAITLYNTIFSRSPTFPAMPTPDGSGYYSSPYANNYYSISRGMKPFKSVELFNAVVLACQQSMARVKTA
jgi:hypothetical protein